MPRVICDLPNAADEISGVKFYPLEDGGRISDEISAELATRFASIPGYGLNYGAADLPKPVEVKPAPKVRASRAKSAEAAPVAAPVAEAAPVDAAAGADSTDSEEVF